MKGAVKFHGATWWRASLNGDWKHVPTVSCQDIPIVFSCARNAEADKPWLISVYPSSVCSLHNMGPWRYNKKCFFIRKVVAAPSVLKVQ